jgi:SAM-dependent methyltransferase
MTTLGECWRRRVIAPRVKRDYTCWSRAISRYLGLSEREVVASLGTATGHSQEDKTTFSERYDAGQRMVTLVNRDAEARGCLSEAWGKLKYVAIRQEYNGFTRREWLETSAIPRVLERFAAARQKGRVPHLLDFGCGTSLFGRLFLLREPSCRLTLCDVDGFHIRFALHECRRLNPCTEAVFAGGDNVVPAFPCDLDVVFSYTAFEHIPNVLDVAKALYGVIRGGGWLFETYAGETGQEPPPDSADSARAWQQRDSVFEFLRANCELEGGELPPRNAAGHYVADSVMRIWRKRA